MRYKLFADQVPLTVVLSWVYYLMLKKTKSHSVVFSLVTTVQYLCLSFPVSNFHEIYRELIYLRTLLHKFELKLASGLKIQGEKVVNRKIQNDCLSLGNYPNTFPSYFSSSGV